MIVSPENEFDIALRIVFNGLSALPRLVSAPVVPFEST
jgi:hypothetical protein